MLEQRCLTCNCYDASGYINGMCTDCYDLYLDIGKENDAEKRKKQGKLEYRREINGYYN